MSILSTFSVRDLFMKVAAEDAKSISKAPGIGAKTAQKLVIELKDKFRLMSASYKDIEPEIHEAESEAEAGTVSEIMRVEAMEALMALGYSKQEAKTSTGKVEITDTMTVEELIKEALRVRKGM